MSPTEVRAIRQQMGFTQVQMARYLGISPREMQFWESETKGRITPLRGPNAILLRIMALKGRQWVLTTWRQINEPLDRKLPRTDMVER